MPQIAEQTPRIALPASGEEVLQAPPGQQILTFMLDGKHYAIRIRSVREILESNTLTHVPLSPPHIRGVLNLRGAVLPVVDLNVRFGGERSAHTKRGCIIILNVESDQGAVPLGMLVDSVCEVLSISDDELRPAPDFGSRIRSDFIEAMGRIEDDFVPLLDPEKLLALEEISVSRP